MQTTDTTKLVAWSRATARWLAVPWRGRALGGALFVGALSLHRSENPLLAGRWSGTYAVLLACGVLAVGAAGMLSRRHVERPWGSGRPVLVSPSLWVDVAALLLGTGYFAGSIQDPSSASRALDLNLVGSVIPAAMVLEWFALTALVIAGVCGVMRLRRRATGPALLLIALAGVFVLLEGVARVAAIVKPEIQGFPTNRSLMWHLRYAQLNSAGFRDAEHAIDAQPGTLRLLVVGDSYAYGAGVSRLADRFGEQFVDMLSTTTGKPWEVITSARPDSHTRDHLQFLEEALRYHPDIVILLYTFNDIDYLRAVTRRSALTEHPRTVLARLHPLRVVIKNSFAAQEGYARWRLLRIGRSDREPPRDPYSDSSALAEHLADLKAFVERARQGRASVAIVPFDISTISSATTAARYEHFVSVLQDAGLGVWSLAGAFDGERWDSLVVNQLDRHPNARAHRLAAKAALTHAEAFLRLEAVRTPLGAEDAEDAQ